MRKITDRQLKYLNILLSEAFGEANRKTYLWLFYKTKSSRDLDVETASEIIEKFVPDNNEREKHIGQAQNKIYEFLGQKTLL